MAVPTPPASEKLANLPAAAVLDGTELLYAVKAGADVKVMSATLATLAASPSGTVTSETSFGQAPGAGVASVFSRGDHTHGTPSLPAIPASAATVTSETNFGQASNAGVAVTFSRGDHTHGTPASPLPADAVGALTNDGIGNLSWNTASITADQILTLTGAITTEPTGFENNEAVTIAYDKTTRTVTLTQAGGVVIYWKGIKRTLASPWVSPAHDDTSGAWFLSTKADADPTWSQVVWDLPNEAPVVYAQYVAGGSGVIFAIREAHGWMQWQAHEELHEQIGTYRRSGGSLTAGTYEIGGTASDARNTPGFDSAEVADEDLPTTLAAWPEDTYSNMYFNGTTTPVIDVAATLPFRVTGTYPNYGSPTVAETEMAAGQFFNVYQILMPVTSDADSQKYRMLTLQPQTAFASLAAAQAEDFRSLSLGTFTGIAPEFVAFARITYGTGITPSYTGATGRCRIEAVAYLTGPRSSQAVSSAVTPASHTVLADRSVADQHPASAITNTPAGNITATTVQAALNELDGDIPLASDAAPADLGVAAAGVGTAFSRDDHVHNMPAVATLSDATPADLGTAAAGVGTAASRDDHVHTLPASDATPADLGVAAAGVGTAFSRDDHVHTLPAIPAASDATPADLGVAAAGVGTAFSRDDHVHNLPAVSASILTGNTIWVDAVNGDDGTGVAGRQDLPFATLEGANASITGGVQTIIVRPGSYIPASGSALSGGVSWYFQPGASVAWNEATALFPSGCTVVGEGIFTASYLAKVDDAGVLWYFECRDLYVLANASGCISMTGGGAGTGPTLTVVVKDTLNRIGSPSAFIEGTEIGRLSLYVRNIMTDTADDFVDVAGDNSATVNIVLDSANGPAGALKLTDISLFYIRAGSCGGLTIDNSVGYLNVSDVALDVKNGSAVDATVSRECAGITVDATSKVDAQCVRVGAVANSGTLSVTAAEINNGIENAGTMDVVASLISHLASSGKDSIKNTAGALHVKAGRITTEATAINVTGGEVSVDTELISGGVPVLVSGGTLRLSVRLCDATAATYFAEMSGGDFHVTGMEILGNISAGSTTLTVNAERLLGHIICGDSANVIVRDTFIEAGANACIDASAAITTAPTIQVLGSQLQSSAANCIVSGIANTPVFVVGSAASTTPDANCDQKIESLSVSADVDSLTY